MLFFFDKHYFLYKQTDWNDVPANVDQYENEQG